MALFVKVKRCHHLGKARAHTRYIAYRSRETIGEERGVFDRESDQADVARFNADLEDPLTRHPMANKAYKLTISLSAREFREAGLTSWKPVIREAMESIQERWGKRFDWIGAEHMAQGHPHAHVVIKATCQDETGRARQLRLDKVHLQELKKEIGRIIERERQRELERTQSRLMSDTLLRAFDAFLHEFAKAGREDSREYEHQEWLRGGRRRPREQDRGDDRGR